MNSELIESSHAADSPISNMHAALQGKGCAVITGASPGGIGFSIAQLLLTRYKKRVVLADIDVSSGNPQDVLVKQGISESDFLLHQCDVTDFDQVQQLAKKAQEWGGKVDFLVLNSGVSVPTKDYGGRIEDWHKILHVNFFGVLNGSQAFVKDMVGLVAQSGQAPGEVSCSRTPLHS